MASNTIDLAYIGQLTHGGCLFDLWGKPATDDDENEHNDAHHADIEKLLWMLLVIKSNLKIETE